MISFYEQLQRRMRMPTTLLNYPPHSDRVEGPNGWYTTPWTADTLKKYLAAIASPVHRVNKA